MKRSILLIILLMSSFSFGDTVLERKIIIPEGRFDSYYLHSLDIFLSKDGSASILIDDSQNLFLYTQNDLKKINKDRRRNIFLNGFVENDSVMLAFVICPEQYRYSGINIYDVQKGFDKPAAYIEIPWKSQDEPLCSLIAVPQVPGKYYILSTQETFLGISVFTRYLCGGYSSGYAKPYLAEIEKNKMSTYKAINYEGKKYEDFNIRECVSDKKMIHYLGLRHPKEHDGLIGPNSPIVLHYSCYNSKEGEVVQSNNIYEIKSDPLNYDFGTLSIATLNDIAFIAFSFHKYPYRGSPQNNIKQVSSDIYFFQNDNKSAKVIKISKGFVPLVKLDSAGNVYVFFLDYNGNIVYKMKKETDWSDEKIIINNLIIPENIKKKYFSIEFDKQNNLHCVYRTTEGIVYTKLKLE